MARPAMGRRVGDWLEERIGWRGMLHAALEEPVPGGASFAYVLGSVLTFCLVLQMVTGIFLAMYYSPSATDAWASVAYIQDQVTLGWLVRGLHHHGASAMVIVAGLHMMQTALFGAYKRPREINWIVGVLLLGLIMAFALTGYLLPWDQTGYWATQVATGIAGSSPVIGEQLKHVMQGGNEYGNLTLTRFFALHVFILPAATLGLVGFHLFLFRRHGVTPGWWKRRERLAAEAQPFWPDQLLRDVVGMAVLFALLIGWNLVEHGAGLDGPADPSSEFDARPEWYFRPLFQALKYFHGPMETIVALGAPVVIGGVLLALPFIDRGPSTRPGTRRMPLAAFTVLMLGGGALTLLSYREDAGNERYQAAMKASDEQAERARALARENGVPPAGGLAVFTTERSYLAKKIWAEACASCHEGDARKGPEIGPGWGSKAWLRDFLRDPGGSRFFGLTKINGMTPVKLAEADLDALIEMLHAERGAAGVEPAKVAKGKALFEDECSACHSLDPAESGDAGPNLAGHGSAAYWSSFIADPGHARFFGAKNEMPPFFDEFGPIERRALAEWLVELGGQAWPARPDARPGVYPAAEPAAP